eukprot:TRINITY_DN1121_c0_g2_i2.p1 TRINITY_DN1121_c0_g2~~TRINITY_DN1121_c0_g2_i2.p1  ORF type:complete len:956 (+),score=111.10 TRINITY_DN1121_c0_g2_i2:412-2868(+)
MGSIPTEIGLLTNLTKLNLTDNDISGQIPKEISCLPRLQNLSISITDINGTIPSNLGQTGELVWLDLHSNKLVGTIPSALGNSTLQHLDLSYNHLCGSIPNRLNYPMVWVSIADNFLNGTIPAKLATSAFCNLYLNCYKSTCLLCYCNSMRKAICRCGEHFQCQDNNACTLDNCLDNVCDYQPTGQCLDEMCHTVSPTPPSASSQRGPSSWPISSTNSVPTSSSQKGPSSGPISSTVSVPSSASSQQGPSSGPISSTISVPSSASFHFPPSAFSQWGLSRYPKSSINSVPTPSQQGPSSRLISSTSVPSSKSPASSSQSVQSKSSAISSQSVQSKSPASSSQSVQSKSSASSECSKSSGGSTQNETSVQSGGISPSQNPSEESSVKNSKSSLQLPQSIEPHDRVLAIVVAVVASVAGLVIVGLVFIIIVVLVRPRRNRGGGYNFEEGSIPLSRLVYADSTIDLTSCKQVSEGSFPLKVSPSRLQFELGSHQADVDIPITDEIMISNCRNNPVSFRLQAPKSPKYNIQFDPESGTVKPGMELNVGVSLVILCSMKVDTDILVLTPTESIPGTSEVFLPLKISLESKLSSSLDFDEILLNEPPIGEGSYGIVYSGKWRGQSVAVKVIKNQDGKSAKTEFFNELKILEAIRCPQIVHFIGAVKIPGKLAIVTEFFPLGNLTSCMKKHQFLPKLKTKCLLDCSRGMAFLHQSSLLHRDLKADNLLVSYLFLLYWLIQSRCPHLIPKLKLIAKSLILAQQGTLIVHKKRNFTPLVLAHQSIWPLNYYIKGNTRNQLMFTVLLFLHISLLLSKNRTKNLIPCGR